MNLSNHLILFKPFNDTKLPVQLGIVEFKESKKKILIAQAKDPLKRISIAYDLIENRIIEITSMQEFTKKNNDLCAKIFRYNEDFHYNLSWLEILQIAATCQYMNNQAPFFIIECIKELSYYYNQSFSQEKFDYEYAN